MIHKKFAEWRQAMLDLEQAHRNNVAPHLRADAMRRAGETHEAVLREMVIEIARLRQLISRHNDAAQSSILEESMQLGERIDAIAMRFVVVDKAIINLQSAIEQLQKVIEGSAAALGEQ